MKLLIDSHALLWAIYEPEHLSPRAKTVVADRSNELFVSLATIWEMGNKIAAGRVPFAGTFPEQLVKRAEDLGSTLLPIHLAESSPLPTSLAITPIPSTDS